MLQKEIEDRIGRKVTTEEYVEANAVYMMAGELDKDEFCREWLKIGSSKLVQCLFEKAHALDQDLQEQELMLKECQEVLSDAADAMLEIEKGILDGETVEHTTQELEKKVWWLIGRKKLVLRKLEKGIALNECDLEYIKNNLK